jgi:aryl-alcohol dehydrogenase-like predicted oxidoreductase
MSDAPRPAVRTSLPRMTDRLLLGNTGLEVSPICLGLVRDPAAISVAYDLGVNFFFLTADMHWPIYENTRQGLVALLRRSRHIRDKIVVAIASYVTQREFTYSPFVEVLDAISGLKRIDIMTIGGSYSVDFLSRQEIYRERVRKCELGARAVGATFHEREAARMAINDGLIDLAFIRYNPVHPAARTEFFPTLQPSKTRIYNFKSMDGYATRRALQALGVRREQWHPSPADYYRFALSQPAIDGVLCSLQYPREVEALERALHKRPLDDDEQEYLITLGKLSRLAATVRPR